MDARLIRADEGDLFHRGNADDHRSAKVKIGQCLRHLQKHRAADTVVNAAAGEQIAVVHLDDRAVEHGDAADLDAHLGHFGGRPRAHVDVALAQIGKRSGFGRGLDVSRRHADDAGDAAVRAAHDHAPGHQGLRRNAPQGLKQQKA